MALHINISAETECYTFYFSVRLAKKRQLWLSHVHNQEVLRFLGYNITSAQDLGRTDCETRAQTSPTIQGVSPRSPVPSHTEFGVAVAAPGATTGQRGEMATGKDRQERFLNKNSHERRSNPMRSARAPILLLISTAARKEKQETEM